MNILFVSSQRAKKNCFIFNSINRVHFCWTNNHKAFTVWFRKRKKSQFLLHVFISVCPCLFVCSMSFYCFIKIKIENGYRFYIFVYILSFDIWKSGNIVFEVRTKWKLISKLFVKMLQYYKNAWILFVFCNVNKISISDDKEWKNWKLYLYQKTCTSLFHNFCIMKIKGKFSF